MSLKPGVRAALSKKVFARLKLSFQLAFSQLRDFKFAHLQKKCFSVNLTENMGSLKD